jgi:hypothetical protein
MQRNNELLKKLKRLSWLNRTEWLSKNPGHKTLSAYAILSALQQPKDWDDIALKCSKNPNHQHFGKTVKEIRTLWSTKSMSGANRGNTLDDWIFAKCSGTQLDTSTFDEQLLNKCAKFDVLYENVISKMYSFVDSEIWLNSKILGLSVKLDSLFETTKNTFLVCEWKNTNNPSLDNRWQKLLGPASHLDDSDLNKWTIQTHIYRFILEEYDIADSIKTIIFNIKEHETIPFTGFDYDANFIRDIVSFSKK